MSRVLECSTAVSARNLNESITTGSQHPVQLFHGVDAIGQMLEDIIGPHNPDAAVFEWPALVQVRDDIAVLQANGLEPFSGREPSPQLQLSQSAVLGPFDGHRLDILVVQPKDVVLNLGIVLKPSVLSMDAVE